LCSDSSLSGVDVVYTKCELEEAAKICEVDKRMQWQWVRAQAWKTAIKTKWQHDEHISWREGR